MMGFLLARNFENARAFYEGQPGFEFVSQNQWALVESG